MVFIAAALTASIGASQIAPVAAGAPCLAGKASLSRPAGRAHRTGLILLSQQPPVPKPFPQPGPPPPAAPPRPATEPTKGQPAPTSHPGQPEAAPTEATLGVPIYPGAQFIASYDAGRGQRYYIFGTAAGFLDLVAYYRNVLKQKGELVFDLPATHEFDVGKFREEAMAFPPGVTIKDYQSDVSAGYPNPRRGGQPARFPTLIQIVPVTER
jgi:hypothetical protein